MLRWSPEDRCFWEDIFVDECLLADLTEAGTIKAVDGGMMFPPLVQGSP